MYRIPVTERPSINLPRTDWTNRLVFGDLSTLWEGMLLDHLLDGPILYADDTKDDCGGGSM